MLLKITDLEISYGSRVTVTDANIELEKGEILSIVGEAAAVKLQLFVPLWAACRVTAASVAVISFSTAKVCLLIHRSNGGKCAEQKFQ